LEEKGKTKIIRLDFTLINKISTTLNPTFQTKQAIRFQSKDLKIKKNLLELVNLDEKE
jgi:hypothetical protein